MTRLVPSKVVAVSEGLVAVAADKWRFAFGFFLHYGHWCANAAASTMTPSSSPCQVAHAVLEDVGGAHRRLLIQWDGHDGLLVLRLGAGVQQWQQAVWAHRMLVVQGVIGLLETEKWNGLILIMIKEQLK